MLIPNLEKESKDIHESDVTTTHSPLKQMINFLVTHSLLYILLSWSGKKDKPVSHRILSVFLVVKHDFLVYTAFIYHLLSTFFLQNQSVI